MNIIKKFFKKLFWGSFDKKYFKIKSIDAVMLEEYHDSLGWYLTYLLDNGLLPDGVIFTGIGRNDAEIELIIEERGADEQQIIQYFRQKGIILQTE